MNVNANFQIFLFCFFHGICNKYRNNSQYLKPLVVHSNTFVHAELEDK